MKTIPLTACPVCGSDTSHPVDTGRDEYTLRGCDRCGATFAPKYADHEEVFQDGYLQGEQGAFGLDCTHPRFRAFLVRCGHRRLEAVEQASGLGRGAELCDTGCGLGELLEAGNERGWKTIGVDPLPDSSRDAREQFGLEVITGTLPTSGLPERSFDAVTACHVLEHMPDSKAFLSEMARWAKPGGVVMVECPNWGSVQRVVSGGRWMGLRPLEHLVHFTRDSMTKAFEHAGLEVLAVRSIAHLDPSHTLHEALETLGRPHWQSKLERFCRTREVEGQRVPVPSKPVWAFLRAIEKRDDRRGSGPVLIAVGRVPV
jgi:2-polyprenyl-3-methyl-5-hydroxy-6-metoxy-1,4-benzoquinol methylase